MEKQKNNLFDDAIKDLENMRRAMKESLKQSEEVKEGNNNENQINDPSYVLFDQITKSTIEILKQPELEKIFGKISETLGDDTAKGLIEIFSASMTHSAYEAIVFYDGLLKIELSNQFDNIGKFINNLAADIKAHNAVLEVHKKDINEIKEEILIKKFKDNTNIK